MFFWRQAPTIPKKTKSFKKVLEELGHKKSGIKGPFYEIHVGKRAEGWVGEGKRTEIPVFNQKMIASFEKCLFS